MNRNTVPQPLVEYLAKIFNDVVEEGRTYPQELKLTLEEFYGYFFGKQEEERKTLEERGRPLTTSYR